MRRHPAIVLFGSLSVIALALVGCAVDPDSSATTSVPSLEPISVETQRGKTLTCPAGSSLCRTVCCPTGSFCTVLRDGTELCQVSPIDPKVATLTGVVTDTSVTDTSAATTTEKTADAGTKLDFYKVTMENVFVSSF